MTALIYQDTFALTSSGDWGAAEIPYTTTFWDSTTLAGGNPGVATAGTATLTVGAGSSSRFGQCLNTYNADGQVLALGSLSALPATAGTVFMRIAVRIQDSANLYLIGWYVTTAGAVKTRISRVVAGTSTIIGSGGTDKVVTASGYQANDKYWLRATWTGTSLQVSAWKDGNAEPGSPTDTATDSTFSTGQIIGCSSGGSGAQTNAVVGQWNSVKVYINGTGSPYVDPAPTVFNADPAKTILGFAPDGLTKFFSAGWTGADDAAGPHNAVLQHRERAFGRRADCVAAYVSWLEWMGDTADGNGPAYPPNIKNNLANIVKGNRTCLISFFNVQGTNAPADWKDISGKYDSVYTSFIEYLLTLNPYQNQIMLRLSWEFNLANWGTNPAGLIAYWNYIVELCRTVDTGRLMPFVWCPSGSGTPTWTDFWDAGWDSNGPGTPEIIGMDFYNAKPFGSWDTTWTRAQAGTNSDFYNTFLAKGKPYIHCETGTRQQSDPQLPVAQPFSAQSWYEGIPAEALTLPNVRQVTFWDNSVPRNDWHLDTVPGAILYPPGEPITHSTVNNPSFDAVVTLFQSAQFFGPVTTPPQAFRPILVARDRVLVE